MSCNFDANYGLEKRETGVENVKFHYNTQLLDSLEDGRFSKFD